MKITIVGDNNNMRNIIKNVVNDLEISDIDIVSGDENKYSIKYYPALIINNVILDDASKLDYNDLKKIILESVRT